MTTPVDPNIFREYDIRGRVGPQLSDASVPMIARSIGTFFRRHGAHKIAIGFDGRSSSPGFARQMADGLNSTGCDVSQIGMVTTPVLYHTLYSHDMDGGVMITGSHNPPDHNGFKTCLGRAALFGPQIREIGDIAAAGEFITGSGTIENIEVLSGYCSDIVSRIDMGERKIRAVIDAGNGTGGLTAVPIYRRLGIDLIELFTDPDPTFPNHHADPTVEDNLADLIVAVRTHKADVGIAFDGDGDRIGVVDENGRVIWGDELMVLFARSVLASRPGAKIIGEVKCSETLFDEIERHGGKPLMWKAGHSLIKAKMNETGAVLAGEMSGHFFFADRYFGFDDAAYAGGRLLEILSLTDRSLSEMLSDIPKKFSTPELRVDCSDDTKFKVAEKVAAHFGRDHEVVTIDGARIRFEHGWGLVRPSNTQAMLILRFEADTAEHLNEIRENVETVLDRIITTLQD